MSNLDLSFAIIPPKGKGKAAAQEQQPGQQQPAQQERPPLDLSFLDKQPEGVHGFRALPSAVEEAKGPAQFVADKAEESFFQPVADFFTGNDRKGAPESRDLPEFDMPFELSARQAKTAAGLLTTMDPLDQVKVLKSNYPKLQFMRDSKDNIIVDGTAEGLGRGFLNLPGVSPRDLLQLGFNVASFTPAAKAARAGGTILGNTARVAAASAGTQAAGDLVSQASGRTDEVSLDNINLPQVAMAGAMGGLAQGLIQAGAGAVPALRQAIARTGITNEVREMWRNAAVKLGFNADDLTDDIIMQVVRSSDEAVSPPTAFAIAGEREFGIPLTAATRSMDEAALSREQLMRTGSLGESAQRTMRGFETEVQQPAINAAREQVESRVAGPPLQAANRGERGDLAGETIRDVERAERTVVSEAYEAVGPAALKPGVFQKMMDSTRAVIDDLNFINEPELTKATQAVLNRLELAGKTLGREVDDLAGKGMDVEVLTPVALKRIEAVRKSVALLRKSAVDGNDIRNIAAIQRRMDDFMDDAVMNALFTGDDAALTALKDARSTFREYAAKFRENPDVTRGGRRIPDAEGKFIEKVIDANPTGEEVINAMFGASGFSKASGAKMAMRFRDILGEDSPAWAAVKQEGLARIFKTNMFNGTPILSGQRSLSALDDAVEKNSSLMNVLYTRNDIGLMRRFLLQVKRTQPDFAKSRENPSGTAQAASKIGAALLRMTRALGTLSEPLFVVTAKGVESARNVRAGAGAKKAVRPFSRIIASKKAVAGTAGGMESVDQGFDATAED